MTALYRDKNSHSYPVVGGFAILEGRCPKCRIRYYGWALREARYRFCPTCDSALEIKDVDETVEGYSSVAADKHIPDSTQKLVHPENKDNEGDKNNE